MPTMRIHSQVIMVSESEKRRINQRREAAAIRELFELYNVSDYADITVREPEFGGMMDRLSAERPLHAHKVS